MVNLRTLISRDHIEQVADIIYKWAPPSDHNNTEKYIERVCEIASVGRSDRVLAANRTPRYVGFSGQWHRSNAAR